jgi:hypothetical protein
MPESQETMAAIQITNALDIASTILTIVVAAAAAALAA